MKWSNEEIEALKKIYPNPNLSFKEVLELLNRSKKSICNKASRLGISRPGIVTNKITDDKLRQKHRLDYDRNYYNNNKKKIMSNKRKRFRRYKQELVDNLGGKCKECGYNKCLAALDFHHHSKDKENCIARLLSDGLIKKARDEAKKCTLLCANCHRERHEGLISIN
jgi:hypothetical protein